MYLRSTTRKKDGKLHRYFSVVESRRLSTGQMAQRTLLYLGEINDKQEASWRKSLSVFDQDRRQYTTMSCFPRIESFPMTLSMAFKFGWENWSCGIHVCLETAGWLVSCGSNWDWIIFGKNACLKAVKRSVGTKFCSCWSSIG